VVRWGFSWVFPSPLPLSLETNSHRRSQVSKQKMQAEKARKFSPKEPVDTSVPAYFTRNFFSLPPQGLVWPRVIKQHLSPEKNLLFTTTSSSVRDRVTPFRSIQKKPPQVPYRFAKKETSRPLP
jgi:hypothetical protein